MQEEVELHLIEEFPTVCLCSTEKLAANLLAFCVILRLIWYTISNLKDLQYAEYLLHDNMKVERNNIRTLIYIIPLT